MAIVRVSCSACGDVELPDVREVVARVCSTDSTGSYNFRCPKCAMRESTPCGPRIIDLLVASGSPLRMWHMPVELSETHVGEPITHDDLLTFHEQLEHFQGSIA